MRNALFTWLAACSLSCTPNGSYEVSEMEIRKVDVPSTGRAHEVVVLLVEGELPNDCWEVADVGFKVDNASKAVTITATRKKLQTRPSRICSPAFSYPKIRLEFIPPDRGTFSIQDSSGRLLGQTEVSVHPISSGDEPV